MRKIRDILDNIAWFFTSKERKLLYLKQWHSEYDYTQPGRYTHRKGKWVKVKEDESIYTKEQWDMLKEEDDVEN